jgi:hypothetical protein
MQEYDPLIDILEHAAESCEQRSKANALRNLQAVLRADVGVSKELQRRMAEMMRSCYEPTLGGRRGQAAVGIIAASRTRLWLASGWECRCYCGSPIRRSRAA